MARRKFRSRFEADDEHSPWHVALFAVVAVLVLGGAIFAGWMLYAQKSADEQIDRASYCPKSGPTHVLAVLVDRTDGINETQAENLKTLISNWAAEVPKNGAFRVYEVKPGSSMATPFLSICNPGDEDEASAWTSNVRKISKRYREMFAGKVEELVAGMQTDQKADSSPIMEAVRDISVREFAGKEVAGRFMIVSDLMQHGGEFSLYRAVPDLTGFRQSPYGRKVDGNLRNVETAVFLLRSSSEKQTSEVVQFWLEWLALQGADVQGLFKVPG